VSEVCSVQRASGGYDYYSTETIPRAFNSGASLSSLQDTLPPLPSDATPNGSGQVARGVLCSAGGRAVQGGIWSTVVVGLVLYWLYKEST